MPQIGLPPGSEPMQDLFDKTCWEGCHDRDCLPECKGLNHDTEEWNCERYRREFLQFSARQ